MTMRGIAGAAGTLAAIMLLTACSAENTGDIGASTEMQTAFDKTVVTVMYSFPLDHFEELVEETYSDIDLQFELNATATINGESERRLRNGHGCDLIITTLPLGETTDYVMDLSAEEFATRYQGTAMTPITSEGRMIYLPLPGQYFGFIVNKAFMNQFGFETLSSQEDILAFLAEGTRQGIGISKDGSSIGIVSVDNAAMGALFVGTYTPDFLGQPEGIKWMGGLSDGTSSFHGVWDDSMDFWITMVQNGYINAGALNGDKNSTPVIQRMTNGTMLMTFGDASDYHEIAEKGEEYEFIMLPFLSNQDNPSWVLSSSSGYIGINAVLSDKENQKKCEAALKIMDLLSTDAGQAAWMEDTGTALSYLANQDKSQMDSVPPGLEQCVKDGYVYSIQIPSTILQYFGRQMVQVLAGKIEMPAALASVDDYARNGSDEIDYDQSIVGSVTEDLIYENYNVRKEETALGNLIADAIAEFCEADIALVNGGSIRSSFYAGDVRGADLSAVCPYDNKLIVIETDGKTIREAVANGLTLMNPGDDKVPGGRFLQVSGLCYTFRRPEGDRPAELLSVTRPDGTELADGDVFTVAISNYMAGSGGYLDNNGDGYLMLNVYSDTAPRPERVKLVKETNATYSDALTFYFKEHQDQQISAKLEGRIKVDE